MAVFKDQFHQSASINTVTENLVSIAKTELTGLAREWLMESRPRQNMAVDLLNGWCSGRADPLIAAHN